MLISTSPFPFSLGSSMKNIKNGKVAYILAAVCGLSVWFRLGKSWFLGYEKTSHVKIQPQAKSKPQHSEVLLSQARSAFWWWYVQRTLGSVGKTWPGLSPTLPSWSPKFHCYLKRRGRKEFFFLFQILGKCLFRSILVSLAQHCCVFLPKELEGYFKNTFTFPISLFILVAPYFLSFCPSFFFDLLGFNVDFLCHGIKTTCFGQGNVDMLSCHADPWLSSIHFCGTLEPLQLMWKHLSDKAAQRTFAWCTAHACWSRVWDRIFVEEQRERDGQ